ncbi:putative metalloprotease CJM1_0395 family protein [Candidatus Nitrospira allomarina]|uniref:Metalloprotease CJM1_0395 family protein n=1 Tax=Candidatus Nitrospira allomarina TaxID=3020900 RepID=A0AA96GB82_9BACT|nr:putative metalloprotease CJM1_0395 family protein [Candidatus Nitrospira allomarina]WNM58854.1 putative metalloprotease CJM1_0395 family protein [Candidatus Nitrospira allomarina]
MAPTSLVPGNPQGTLQKAQQIGAAALVPVGSSSQDRAVALSANAFEAAARQELQRKTKQCFSLSY